MHLPGNEWVTNYALDATFKPLDTATLQNSPIVYTAPPTPITKPTVVDAFYCPAWFVVEGLPNCVAFWCEGVKGDDGVGRFRITRLIVESSDGGAITEVERLPLSTMLELAYKAAAILAVAYPAGYHGPDMSWHRGRLIRVHGVTVSTDSLAVIPLVNARNVTAAEVRRMAGRAKGSHAHSRQPRGKDFLKAVAKAYNDTSKDRRGPNGKRIPRDRQAADNLAAAGYTDGNGLPFGNEWLRASKRRAIDAGYKITEWRQPKGGKK